MVAVAAGLPCPVLSGVSGVGGPWRVGIDPCDVDGEAWLYLANAFDGDGRGLFVEPVIENLRIAQDYVLMQSVLPRVSSQRAGASGIWSEVSEYLAPRFPRAYAWVVTSHSPETAESRREVRSQEWE